MARYRVANTRPAVREVDRWEVAAVVVVEEREAVQVAAPRQVQAPLPTRGKLNALGLYRFTVPVQPLAGSWFDFGRYIMKWISYQRQLSTLDQ